MVPVQAYTEQMRARAATGLSVQESAQSGSASEPRAATAVEWVARAGVVVRSHTYSCHPKEHFDCQTTLLHLLLLKKLSSCLAD
jgi:hypothetical protein